MATSILAIFGFLVNILLLFWKYVNDNSSLISTKRNFPKNIKAKLSKLHYVVTTIFQQTRDIHIKNTCNCSLLSPRSVHMCFDEFFTFLLIKQHLGIVATTFLSGPGHSRYHVVLRSPPPSSPMRSASPSLSAPIRAWKFFA